MKKLLKYITEYQKECILGPLFKLLEACFDLTVPMVMAWLIDRGISQNNVPYIWKMGGLLLVLAAIGLTCSITAQYFAAKAAVGFATKLRHAVFEHIESLSFTEMDEAGTSMMITRMTSDINQVQSGTNLALRLFLRSPFIVFGAAIMAFTIDVKAALIFAVVIPLLAIVVFGIMLMTMPMYQKVQGHLDLLLGVTRQNLSGVRVIRAFNKEQAERESFRQENDLLTRMQLFVGRISALMNPVTYIMINGALVALIWTGAVRINMGTLTQGQIVALINYMSQILVELVKLANTIIMTTKCVACGNRIQSLLEVNSSLEDGNVSFESGQDKKPALVEFDHVALAYKGAGEASLEDITFTAEPGQTIGIIGGTGSGKTSLVHMIPRFYDATEGSVRINGQDVKSYRLEELRQNIGIVMQKAVLFHGSIRENIRYGKLDATDEEVIQAAKAAHVHRFVKTLPGGYDMELNEEASNVSQGQKQLLTIARAILADPKILILDEATSSVDTRTEVLIQKAMDNLMKGRTSFVIAHRLSTIRDADLILVMKDGDIVEQGNHEELLAKGGFYADLYNSQFENAGECA